MICSIGVAISALLSSNISAFSFYLSAFIFQLY